jgi:predicted patatin/cPLA2 family phospholipase
MTGPQVSTHSAGVVDNVLRQECQKVAGVLCPSAGAAIWS